MNRKNDFSQLNRREFTQFSLLAGAAFALTGARSSQAASGKNVLFYKNLGPGHIGVSGSQKQMVDYAIEFGFGGVSVQHGDLLQMSREERQDLVSYMKENGIAWGPSGVPLDFRKGEDAFKDGLKKVPGQAKVMEEVGASRVSTWIMPGHDQRNYLENFNLHKRRLTEIAKIYKDHGIRFGLEFVGPKTLRDRFRYEFIYTMSEMLQLCDAIGTGNMGLLLDSWHWHTSHGTVGDINRLRNHDVVDVHVNDAPRYIVTDRLIDNVRRLPVTTGVIDMKGFINALKRIGYDGPVSCEPFDNELRAMDNKPALKKTIAALNRTWELIQ